jgi:hypothetical protein
MERMSIKNPVVLGIWSGVATLLVATILPIWIVWHTSEVCGVGSPGTLWSALLRVPEELQRNGLDPLIDMNQSNFATAGAVYVLSWTVGGVVYWWRKRSLRPKAPPGADAV